MSQSFIPACCVNSQWRRMSSSLDRAEAISRELWQFGSVERGEAVAALRGVGAAVWWRVVAHEWSGFDLIDHAAYSRRFRSLRRFRPEEVAADVADLPARLIKYRGQCVTRPVGLSWTRDRDIAAGFARGHRGLRNPSPVLLAAELGREEVAMVVDDRGESEVVLFTSPAEWLVLRA